MDCTTLLALNDVSCQQIQPTEETNTTANRLLENIDAHPNACIRHYVSHMILWVDSDSAYLVCPGDKSRAAGHCYLSDHPNRVLHPMLNREALAKCKELRHVISSVAESEVSGLFYNSNATIPMQHTIH